ncbi:DEAD/DEAH box helicase [Nocardia amikacinitolerans]|uniref:DEAD/DEAH box helicase n=1 Tax=Nocardia amikacinitolerans TaxID=756689 RepID=UPI0036BFA026
MAKSRTGRKQQAIQSVIASGPLTTDQFIAELAERGLRVDSGELYLLCTEYRLANFDKSSGKWFAPGTVVASEARQPARHTTRQLREQRTRALSTDRRRELETLRDSVIRPSDESEPTRHPVDPSWPAVAATARTALIHELHAVTSHRSQQEIPLVAGELIEEAPTRMLVRYEIQSGDNVREGLIATLVPEEDAVPCGAAVEAEVLTQYGSEITLKLPADTVFRQRARLRCDLSWLVSRQVTTLNGHAVNGAPGFHTAAALSPVGPGGLLDSVPPVGPHPVAGLNESQQLAVAHGLQPRVTWLWGPPGTGKTTTLAALLGELLDDGKSVLLTAPTNAAVDVALKALLSRRPGFAVGELARIGLTDDPALLGLRAPVVLDEIAAAAGAEPARRLVEVRASLAELRERAHAVDGKSVELQALTRKIADLSEFRQGLEKLVQDVRDQVIRDAKLIACTTHQVLLRDLHRKHFDTVVIDEASMVTAAMAMLVAGAGEGHTVIAGDFRQLPPIVQATTSEAREWLGLSVFEKSGMAEAVRTGRPPANMVALNQQHRMRRQIGDAIGEAFYPEARLRTAASVHKRPARTMPADQPQLVVVDTTGLLAPVARRGGSASRYNLMHAQLAANAIRQAGRDASEPASLGLISPFASQASLLQSLAPANDPRLLASTVHRFQGGETDVVVYDTVDSTGSSFTPHRWFTETHMGSEGARLLNVAMSRAREQAILLADMFFLRQNCPPRTPVHEFLTHITEYAEVYRWQQIASAAGPTELESGLDRLLDDLSRATSSIDIFTAATDGPFTRGIVEILLTAAANVKIAIWYKPDDRGSESLIEAPLRNHHTTLHPLRPVRESCVVVDSVVWSATGPILGRETGPILRTDLPALADGVRRQLLRRTISGVPGTGEHAERCKCGSLRFREEVTGGPRAGVHSVCLSCRD